MKDIVRLAHMSDVHLSTMPLGWQFSDWFSKRLTGWINTRCFSRRRRFRYADEVMAVLVAELRGQQRPDGIVFSGDATMLGFASEVERAAAVLQVGNPAMPPGFAVPGNHDYYVPAAEVGGAFERCFAPWQQGERIGAAVYPFARRIGRVWLVGVNSCTGNGWPWDATGRVQDDELERLGHLLKRLDDGPRILVTHYPVSDAQGQAERPFHKLHNLSELVEVAQRGGVCLWLHGHRHQAYHLDDPHVAPFPVICAGSTTEVGQWGYNDYVIDGLRLQASRRTYDVARSCFAKTYTFELQLRA